MSFINELFAVMRVRKRYWLAPALVIMLLLGVLLVFTSGSANTGVFNYFDF